MTVAELDSLPAPQAGEVLRACCGASRWIEGMIGRRPFRDQESLLASASEVWQGLETGDWKEAFANHPRIGESEAVRPQNFRGKAWSAAEQAQVSEATPAIRQALAEVNRQYEARFGYTYIVCADGRTPGDLLGSARARLQNDPESELRVAANEQLTITLLRLRRLLTPLTPNP